MAAPVKKRDILQETHEERDTDDDDEVHDSPAGEGDEGEQGMEIQVDFEGRNPQDPDFHGIKTLLQQLFLKAHIDLGGLAELIITQNYIGSVVKQSDDLEEYSDDDEVNDVFGITTVINVSHRQNVGCIKELRDLLKQLANDYATDADNVIITNILENDTAQLGLLINERFINIPAQIAVPLFENLLSEMKRASSKNMPFNFSYYILICKLYKWEDYNKTGKRLQCENRNTDNGPVTLWSNREEEIFAEEATVSFEFSVEKDTDTGLSGMWTEMDDEMIPYRRVILFEASKLPSIIDKIKSQLS